MRATIVRNVANLTPEQRVRFGCAIGDAVDIEEPNEKYQYTRFGVTGSGLVVALWPSEFEALTWDDAEWEEI